jgi:hypothetical protein
VSVRGERTHVRADLRHNDLSTELADPRDSAQPLDGVTKAGEPGIDLPIKLSYGGIKRIDLLHMQLEQEAMVAFDPSTQSFAQRCHAKALGLTRPTTLLAGLTLEGLASDDAGRIFR